ncbi:MAG: right-handed parallel beta-helix repeat-containing protein, partial [Acidobacteriota bacterium]
HGLGIRVLGGADGSRLAHCVVERGRATGASPLDSGGGLYIEGSNPDVRHCTIRNNFAKRSGGAIHLENSSATLRDNVIVDNTAGGGGGSASGGAISMRDSAPTLTGNTVRGNSVSVSGSYTTPSGLGGAIYSRSSDPWLERNVISDNVVSGHLNSDARGGAMYVYYGDPVLLNNTFSDNRTENGSGVYQTSEGGGLYIYYASPVLVNTILWNNEPEEIWINAGSSPQVTAITYSDVRGGRTGIVSDNPAAIDWLEGNIDADPLFVDPAAGEYALQAGSPAIDAGAAYFELGGEILLDLSPEDYVGPAPDIGALEFGSIGASPPAGSPGEASRISAGAQPLVVNAFDPATGEVSITFAPACGATDHVAYSGDLSSVASLDWNGATCGLGNDGAATVFVGEGSRFFVVVGHDDAVEGSYGRTSAAAERPEAEALATCDLPQRLADTCD